MYRKTYYLLVAIICFFFASCEKEVHINLGTSAEQLVVQGQIETNTPPFVLLTHTIGFFSNVDISTLQNTFVHGATVKVSDGIKTITLKEYTLDTAKGSKFYVYSVDTTNPSDIMLGETGKNYTLTISYNGQTYTSQTKLAPVKGLDSVYFGPPVFKRRETPDNALEMFGDYTDPDTMGNYVRYFTRRSNRDQFYPGNVFNDQLVNGKHVGNIDIFAGYNDSINVKVDSVIYFYPGDSVTLKWCEIDRGVYDFWNTYQFSIQSSGNPFATPINIKSNITNGALGVWAGYSSLYYFKVVQ